MNITNDIVAAYVQNLYTCANANLNNLRAEAEQNHVPIILRDTEGLLKTLLMIKKPARVLEIGTAVGYSSCVFTDTCDCNVTTVELDDSVADTAEANIERLGFADKITVLRGDAAEVLKNIETNDFDFVFIDAAKSHYRQFWDLILPHCAEDAVIVCDNVLQKGMTASDEFDTRKRYKTSIRKMRDFLEYITVNFDTCVLPVGDGVSITNL